MSLRISNLLHTTLFEKAKGFRIYNYLLSQIQLEKVIIGEKEENEFLNNSISKPFFDIRMQFMLM